jgi:hypothetical protein
MNLFLFSPPNEKRKKGDNKLTKELDSDFLNEIGVKTISSRER